MNPIVSLIMIIVIFFYMTYHFSNYFYLNNLPHYTLLKNLSVAMAGIALRGILEFCRHPERGISETSRSPSLISDAPSKRKGSRCFSISL